MAGPMKVVLKLSERMTVEYMVDKSPKMQHALAAMAQIDELAPEPCGICGCEEVRFVMFNSRNGNSIKYFSCANRQCGAQLPVFQTKDGAKWFIGRKDQQGQFKPNGGWEIYQPQQQTTTEYSEPVQQASQPSSNGFDQTELSLDGGGDQAAQDGQIPF